MQTVRFISLSAALAFTAPAAAAGLNMVDVPADSSGPAIKVAVWYPSDDPPSPVQFGSFILMRARDGALRGQKLPLVVMTHGRGASFVGNSDTAEHLADQGFVVAALNHPGDTASDKSRIGELSIYLQRPKDVSRVIDHLTTANPWSATVDSSRIGIFGFSRGGYTGLVTVGARPDFAAGLP